MVAAAASVTGGLISSSGAKSAANTQANATNQATALQKQMFDQIQQNLQPYMQSGAAANNALLQLTGLSPFVPTNTQNTLTSAPGGATTAAGGTGAASNVPTFDQWVAMGMPLAPDAMAGNSHDNYNQYIKALPPSSQTNKPAVQSPVTSGAGAPSAMDVLNSPLLKAIMMDQATLEKTPGYQFNLTQGLKATQNAAAARGLGLSGAALKGAASYATGLADNTYQNQFANALTNQTNQFNRLLGLQGQGQNAAAGLGGFAQSTGENLANTLIGGAKAQAGSQIAGSNALGAGLQGAGNALGAGGIYGNSNNSGYNSGFYNPGTYDFGAASLSGLPWSDRRLKENITSIGYENGHKIYKFNYIWSPEEYIGVMADEVMQAAIKVGKYFKVDYSKLGVEFRRAE